MDRLILQPGAIPLDTDGGSIQRNAMIALGYLAQATFGTTTVVDGLVCGPTAPASMVVNVGQGSIFMLSTIDATNFGSLALDNTDPLVKLGINAIGATPFTLTAPGTSGQSINYLIEATLQESDGTPVVLPYYNPSNPSMPYSGPSNSGVAQNTVRTQSVELQLKAGVAATTGTQTTPAVDSGWVGLYVITVNFGALTVVAGNISQYPGAPFIPWKLGLGSRAVHLLGTRSQVYNAHGVNTFTVPANVFRIDYELWGPGSGGSGGASLTAGGAAGGGGGYSGGSLAVLPGDTITATIGQGTAGATNTVSTTASASTLVHGATTITANGGVGTTAGGAAPGVGGTASGGALNIQGGTGGDILDTAPATDGSANGGASPRGGPGGSGTTSAGSWPGGGGGANDTGGSAGADGGCILRY